MDASASSIRSVRNARLPVWIAPIGALLVAIAVRMLLIARTGFDGLYGQDAFAYFDYAAALKTAVSQGHWPPPFFWPIGYPALAAALSTLLSLTAAAQAVSIAAGVLVAVLTCLMVCEIVGHGPAATLAGLFAGALVASAGQLLISSLCAMSDAASLFWATSSAFGLVRFHRTYDRRWLALAGFALGWAVMTRWVYALLLPVWGATLIVEIRAARALLSAALIAGAFFLLALVPQGLLVAEEASRGNPAYVGDAEVYSWNPANAGRSDLVNADGHFVYPWPVGVFYSLPILAPDYMPLWFTPLGVLGIWALRRQRFYMILLLGWFGLMWGFLIGVLWENWRFPLAFFPPLSILAGVGLHELLRRAPARSARLVGGWLAIGLIAMLGWGMRDAEAFVAHQSGERAIVQWASAQLPADATVITFQVTAWFQHLTSLRIIEMVDASPAFVERVARERQDVFVLVNMQNINSQWQGLAPEVNFKTLDNRFVLRQMGSRGEYVLYAVGSER